MLINWQKSFSAIGKAAIGKSGEIANSQVLMLRMDKRKQKLQEETVKHARERLNCCAQDRPSYTAPARILLTEVGNPIQGSLWYSVLPVLHCVQVYTDSITCPQHLHTH